MRSCRIASIAVIKKVTLKDTEGLHKQPSGLQKALETSALH